MNAVLKELRNKVTAKQAVAAETYHSLVVDVADEKETDPDNVLVILEAAGKTCLDLERDVQDVVERRELTETLAAGKKTYDEKYAAYRRDRVKLDDEIKAFNKDAIARTDALRRVEDELRIINSTNTETERRLKLVTPKATAED